MLRQMRGQRRRHVWFESMFLLLAGTAFIVIGGLWFAIPDINFDAPAFAEEDLLLVRRYIKGLLD